jgi:hypothetical protein
MFRSTAVTVEFSDGKATFTSPRGLLIAAAYRVLADTIQFRDESGPAACPTQVGRYLWRIDGDTLRFRYLDDACAGRRSAFAATWIRVASALVLTGATVIDGTGAAARTGMTLVLRDGIIAAIHPDGTVPIPIGAEVRDARGQWIIPGLIDAHVHVATDPNGSDRRDRVELRLRNALLGGVVAVRDMGGDARALADLSRAAVTGQIVSPLIRYSAIMAGPDCPRSERRRCHWHQIVCRPGLGTYRATRRRSKTTGALSLGPCGDESGDTVGHRRRRCASHVALGAAHARSDTADGARQRTPTVRLQRQGG